MPKKQGAQKKKNIKISKEKLNLYREIFDILDKNETGTISLYNFMKIRYNLFYPITERIMNKFVKEVNVFNDGNVDFEGFISFVKKQMEYIEENDENTAFKNIKDEIQRVYLGNKRRRNKTSKRDNVKNRNKNKIEKSFDNIIVIDEENDNDNDELFGSFFNNKKKKLNNTISYNLFSKEKNKNSYNKYNNIIQINDDCLFDDVNEKKIVENNENDNLFNDQTVDKYQPNFNNENKKNKNKNENKVKKQTKKKKENESKKELIADNNITIYKKDLPRDLVNKIENKYKIFIPEIHYNNNINISINSDLSSLSKKCNLNESNLCEENSFSSVGFNNNTDNKKLNLGNLDTSKEKNLVINNISSINSVNSLNSSKSIDRSKGGFFDLIPTDKLNDEKIEKISNIPYNNNIFLRRDIPDYQRRNQQDIKSNSSNNNSLYFTDHDNNFNFCNNIYLNEPCEVTDITNNRYKYNDEFNMKNDFLSPDEVEKESIVIMEKDENKSKQTNKSSEKLVNENVHILNTLELEYKLNKKKEKIIKKCIEVPYLIIIDKDAINMEDLKNKFPDNSIILNKDKSFSFSSKNNSDNINENNNENNNKSLHLETFQIQINNEENNIPEEAKNEKITKNPKTKKNKNNNKKEKNIKKRTRTEKKDKNNYLITSYITKLRSESRGKKRNKYFENENEIISLKYFY